MNSIYSWNQSTRRRKRSLSTFKTSIVQLLSLTGRPRWRHRYAIKTHAGRLCIYIYIYIYIYTRLCNLMKSRNYREVPPVQAPHAHSNTGVSVWLPMSYLLQGTSQPVSAATARSQFPAHAGAEAVRTWANHLHEVSKYQRHSSVQFEPDFLQCRRPLLRHHYTSTAILF